MEISTNQQRIYHFFAGYLRLAMICLVFTIYNYRGIQWLDVAKLWVLFNVFLFPMVLTNLSWNPCAWMIYHIRWSRNCLWWPVCIYIYIYTRNDGLSSTDALSANQTDVLNCSFFWKVFVQYHINCTNPCKSPHFSVFSQHVFLRRRQLRRRHVSWRCGMGLWEPWVS